jgi:hypothetical protein
MVCISNTVTGVGAWYPAIEMREAETTTCSVSCAAATAHIANILAELSRSRDEYFLAMMPLLVDLTMRAFGALLVFSSS